MLPKTIEWKENKVIILDQRRLPEEEVYLECKDVYAVAEAIKTLAIRGAPAIGIAAAMGTALGALGIEKRDFTSFYRELLSICHTLEQTRPTAINLHWALQRMKVICETNKEANVEALKELLVTEALAMLEEDIEINKRIGEAGKDLIRDGDTILTHCNAGALATGGYGTALGVIRRAWEQGKGIKVVATETRPLLQGARLTAWELKREGIPVTLITDHMAGYLMKRGEINLIIVGADRIACNGDVANKIGTYTLAVLAKENDIPFYVAAPLSTFDQSINRGEEIPIEERGEEEVIAPWGKRIAPMGIGVRNPAFDITPHRYVTAIVTERGVIRAPFKETLKRMWAEGNGK
ncbi:MAG: S-methyl-5-thioribose-1-phosphate isomerase [Deltaproteobacteria bacterium]|nr:MAG: S-methyl-5-thioribose-1-phosphate isomerase [Deltaproteobacteria bacterium]